MRAARPTAVALGAAARATAHARASTFSHTHTARLSRAGSSLSRGATVRSVHNAASIAALASNLRTGADVEDLYITYGGRNSALSHAHVRPLAVVKVGGEVITKDIDNLVQSLQFLREFGLQPVVVHGGGPQLNDELARAGVVPEYIGGHRVTTPETMRVARRVFESANDDLAGALRAAGLPVCQIKGGVFQAEVHDRALGLVGEIKRVEGDAVEAAIADGKIPVLTSLGINGVGDTLNINADVAARELAITLRPLKVVFISAGGGWKEDGKVVDEVNMAQDYPVWVQRDYTGRQGTLLKLNEMKQIVDNLPPSSSVTIASAAALRRQLLPHRGPGSQIRRGIKLCKFDSVGSTDRTRLEALLRAGGAEAALRLVASGGVAPEGMVARIVATEDYSGVAIVTKAAGAAAVPILHTLALTPLAYAEGTERALWRAVTDEFPSLAWLGRASSPIASAAEEVQKGGVDAVPKAFPPLSSRRSLAYATGGVSLDGGQLGDGAAALFRNVDATSASEAVSAVRSFSKAIGAASPAVIPRPVAAPSSGSSSRPIRVGLLGARGYVGREFVRLVAGHPSMQIVCASSRALVGQDVLTALGVPDAAAAVSPGLTVSDVGPEQLRAGKAPAVDVWVLALPNGLAAEHSAAVDAAAGSAGKAPLLIDLSADMRFDKSGSWAYGLPERPGAREKLRSARKISNPGCYATGAQAALMPLLPQYNTGSTAAFAWDLRAKPHVFGVSGYSGAGTTPSDKNDPNKLRDNLLAYSLVNHIHEREVGFHCGTTIAFMPHVAPFFQGISLTVTGHVVPSKDVTAASLHSRFLEFYDNERLIRVLKSEKDMPDVRTHGSYQHGVTVGGITYDPATGRVALVSVIDNLLKGAATQAVQNLNLALGLDEYAGIPM